MTHSQLWAPWRLPYIVGPKAPEPAGCFICRYSAEQKDAENFVVSRHGTALTILNRFPYNNGHTLIAPVAHKGRLEELDDAELLDCMQSLQRLTAAMQRILNPEGFNVGLNLGKVAGAGLPGHLHWHLVPRWNGDTNFMPILADANVIPQSLQALYELLQPELGSAR